MNPDLRLAMTGTGTVLHIHDPAAPLGQPATLCGRPNACTAGGYGTVAAPRQGVPTCSACFATAATL